MFAVKSITLDLKKISTRDADSHVPFSKIMELLGTSGA
jgi:hypothetical protein